VQSVHEKNLIYRDIKPDNFLIGRPGTKNANLVSDLVIVCGAVCVAERLSPRSGTYGGFRDGKAVP
jgi:serine/threonine protein kinase